MLELYYNFFDFREASDVSKFEELEKDTYSFYLVLAEENLYDCNCSEKKTDRKNLRKELQRIEEIHLEQF